MFKLLERCVNITERLYLTFLSVNHIYDYLKLLGLITFKHILVLLTPLRVFSRSK